ncbi:mannose/glucose-specific lectin-like [Abrus precatorius]|uniref:Mannose/glucose-specific lectin-like n=1 Tax=Abrus precatorius TaxID=3816 RepID=A0A8B8M778_ABRPR|nr:mannose/glucose-specific lectin-like [Abrus precatorius]
MSKHLKTHAPFPAFLVFFLVLLLLLSSVKSESLSFNFPNFGQAQDLGSLRFLGDARPLSGVIQLTRRDEINGTVTVQLKSVGRVVYIPRVHLWDKSTGKHANFETEFTFVVDSAGSQIHADGLSFFIIPSNDDPIIPKNSFGGFLGLFNPEIAFNEAKNQIVAIEFDSFGNEWDPIPTAIAPHIGIDINSIESKEHKDWPINSVPERSIAKAIISYNSNAKELRASVSYPNIQIQPTVVSQNIDLSVILPEWVRIGFSGATGLVVETHDILSWSFNSLI